MRLPFLSFAQLATFALGMAGFHPGSLQAQEYDLGLIKSQRTRAISGHYVGEIRLQSSNGVTDHLIRSRASLSVQVHPDSLEVQSTTDFLGDQCQSKIGEILELKKFSEQGSQILTAEFAFHSGKCFDKYRAKSLTLIIWENDHKEVVVETLLNSSFGLSSLQNQKLFVHGYFTKSNPHLVPNRAPAVAQSGTM
jgi:hypothetical protein